MEKTLFLNWFQNIRFQFSLLSLFLLTTAVGLVLAIFAYPVSQWIALALLAGLARLSPTILAALLCYFGPHIAFGLFLRLWCRTP